MTQKSILFILITIIASLLYINLSSQQLAPQQKSANFQPGQIAILQDILRKANTGYSYSYQLMSIYIQGQIKQIFPGYWIIAAYRKSDFNSLFYLTGQYDDFHRNKRYYQVQDYDALGLSFLILEVNNTSPTPPPPSNDMSLQYTKNKSDQVTTAQQAGIDLAMTTAYTWNKNIVDFTKVAQRLIQTNLGQHWQVCTRNQNINLNNFGFRFSSPYRQWIQYDNYGINSYHWHVYLWRNYINA